MSESISQVCEIPHASLRPPISPHLSHLSAKLLYLLATRLSLWDLSLGTSKTGNTRCAFVWLRIWCSCMHLCAVGGALWSNKWNVCSCLKLCKRKKNQSSALMKEMICCAGGIWRWETWKHFVCAQRCVGLRNDTAGSSGFGSEPKSERRASCCILFIAPQRTPTNYRLSGKWLKYIHSSHKPQGKQNMAMI